MIRRQSQIAIIVSMCLLTLAGAVTIWSFFAIHRSSEHLGAISELERSIVALKDIGGEFDHRFDARFVRQWDAIEVAAKGFMSRLDSDNMLDAGIRSELDRRLDQMRVFFQRLRASTVEGFTDRELESYFRARINSNADAIIERLEKNKRVLRSEHTSAEIATFSAVLVCIVIAGANIWLFYGLIIRPILAAFGTLRKEAARIGQGDLQASVIAPTGGEIGLLFQSVEAMRVNLDALTKDLEAQRKHAEEAGRAKTDFLANMSHELRTPLNAVIGYADLLEDLDGNDDASQKRKAYVQGISVSGRHLLSLINDVLDFAKINSDKFTISHQSFDFHSEIASIKSAFHEKATENRVEISIDLKNAPRLIVSDPMRVRQIMYNLVGNAVKFTTDGTVQVSFVLHDLGGRRASLRIQVEDDGIGIDPERVEQIFCPFDQADNSISRRFGGTGLGLPITKSITEALGGGISVTSSPGNGARFVATIEIEDYSDVADTAINGGAGVSCNKSGSFGFHVLVADDVMINREVASELLGRLGCTVDTAEDGAEAVEKARSGAYDFIMLDVHMPVMDGVEAARQIRALDVERKEPTLIFAWTADVLQPGSLEIGPGGWNGVILKPVSKENLESVLTSVTQDVRSENDVARPSV